MEISLPRELQELVKQKVESGRYYSASEVIVDALWLLDARDRFVEMQTEELRKEIQKGLDSGPATAFDFEELKAKARQRVKDTD